MTDGVTLLGLDVGQARIGVARGNTVARLATPLAVVEVNGQEISEIQRLINQETATELVVGLPRGLNGQDTLQTQLTKQFGSKLESLGLDIHWQDEAGTSVQAQEQGRSDKIGSDARAAALILQDYLNEAGA